MNFFRTTDTTDTTDTTIWKPGFTRFICKNLKTSAFNFSAPKMSHVRSSRSVAKTVKSSSTTNPNLPKRDLATKYFGEHLYSLPVGVIGQETVVRSEKSRRKR